MSYIFLFVIYNELSVLLCISGIFVWCGYYIFFLYLKERDISGVFEMKFIVVCIENEVILFVS